MIEFLYIYLFIAVLLGFVIVVGMERYKGEIFSDEDEYKVISKTIPMILPIIPLIVIFITLSILFRKL